MLLIPGHNDSSEEIARMCRWVMDELGPDVPHHFSAFHPDNRMRDDPPPQSSPSTGQGDWAGRRATPVHLDNVRTREGVSTRCPRAGRLSWERIGFQMLAQRLDGGGCASCGTAIPRVWDAEPGDFGNRRIPVRLVRYSRVRSALKIRMA